VGLGTRDDALVFKLDFTQLLEVVDSLIDELMSNVSLLHEVEQADNLGSHLVGGDRLNLSIHENDSADARVNHDDVFQAKSTGVVG